MFDFVVFVLFACGMGLIVYSAIKFKPAEKAGTRAQVEEALVRIETTVADADHAMVELSKLSQTIFDEITLKYKELLYLYELIDQKKLQTGYGTAPTQASPSPQPVPLRRETDNTPTSQFANVAPRQARTATPTPEPNRANQSSQPSTDDGGGFMNMFNAENSKHKEINDLYRRGMTVSEIARSLNIGHGEVSLVIEMRRGK